MYGSKEFVEGIKSYFLKEEFSAKTLLVKEGTLAKKLFFIEKGCCRCWFDNDGKDVTLQFIFENHFVSSMETIIAGEPSWYSIETLEPAVMYSMPIDEFKNKKETIPEIQSVYYNYIEKRLLLYQKLFVSRIRDTPEQRYEELFSKYPEIIRRVPQHYIASFLGITSVSLSRIRNRK